MILSPSKRARYVPGCIPTKFAWPLPSVSPLRSDGPAIVIRTPGIGRPRASVTVIAMPERDAGAGAGRRAAGAVCGGGVVWGGVAVRGVCANDVPVMNTKLKHNSVLKRIWRLCLYRFRTWTLQ